MDGGPRTTVDAKRRDLELFLDYFGNTLLSDNLDDWTKSSTRGFIRWLATEANDGSSYAATSVNRTLATVRHFAKFIANREGFRYGDPMEYERTGGG